MKMINAIEFTENNIQFRIISAKLLERYKATQSFILMEMLHGDYKFSKTSREISLLVTDISFSWIMSLESYLIRDGVSQFTKEAADFAEETLDENRLYVQEVFKKNPSIFDEKIVKVWRKVQDDKIKISRTILDKCVGKEDMEAFSIIANTLIEALSSLKFELYEIDYIVNNGKRPFLCLTDLNVLLRDFYDENLLTKRALIYKKCFNIDSFALKNYSQEDRLRYYSKDLERAGISLQIEEYPLGVA